jgi:Domain of unknown function (DUF5615)
MLRLVSDENFNGDIVRGLLLPRPTLDLGRLQDTGLEGVEDPAVLTWAAEHNRILLTQGSSNDARFCMRQDGGALRTGMPVVWGGRASSPHLPD